MIFRPELVKLILQGKKSMTRRPAGDQAHCRYRPGHAYQVQPGRGRKGLFPITIQAVRFEYLGEITFKDARREGFHTRQEFIDYWTALHGHYNHDLRVWVIGFTLGDTSDTPRLLAARPHIIERDYVDQRRLAMRAEPEAISQGDATRYSTISRARDDQQRLQQLQEAHQQIAQGLELARQAVNGNGFNRSAKKTIRALEHHAAALDQKTA